MVRTEKLSMADTCGGKPRPAGTKDYTCENGVWVEVEIPEVPEIPDVQPPA